MRPSRTLHPPGPINNWKLTIDLWRIKVMGHLMYLKYRFNSWGGIKTIGFGKYGGLVLIKLLAKHKVSTYSMHVTSAKLPLHPKNVAAIHRTGFRLDPADYISIIFNPYSFQVKLGIGENLRQYINGDLESEIVDLMQTKLDDREIIAGIESGIIKVNQYLPKNLKRKT